MPSGGGQSHKTRKGKRKAAHSPTPLSDSPKESNQSLPPPSTQRPSKKRSRQASPDCVIEAPVIKADRYKKKGSRLVAFATLLSNCQSVPAAAQETNTGLKGALAKGKGKIAGLRVSAVDVQVSGTATFHLAVVYFSLPFPSPIQLIVTHICIPHVNRMRHLGLERLYF